MERRNGQIEKHKRNWDIDDDYHTKYAAQGSRRDTPSILASLPWVPLNSYSRPPVADPTVLDCFRDFVSTWMSHAIWEQRMVFSARSDITLGQWVEYWLYPYWPLLRLSDHAVDTADFGPLDAEWCSNNAIILQRYPELARYNYQVKELGYYEETVR